LLLPQSDWRLTDWMGGGAHPKILELSDLPAILQSEDFFARKFAPNSPLIDAIDRTLNANREY